MAATVVARPAWYRKARNVLREYEAARGQPANDDVRKVAARMAAYINDGVAHLNEEQSEWGHEIVTYWVKNDKYPGTKVREMLHNKARATVAAHVAHYHATHPSFFESLNPAKLISAAANIVSAVAPFVDMAIKLVPGAGQIYSAAKSAVEMGVSLAKGRPLTDAFMDAALDAIPGGDIAKRAGRAVVALAKGRSLTGELLDQVKEQFPGADHAITVAAGIVHGRKLQDMALDEVKGLAADQIKSLKLPIPSGVDVPVHMQGGFQIGLGVLNNATLPSGGPLTPAAALAIRARLEPAAQAGFDKAMAMRALKHLRAGSPHVPRPPRPSSAAHVPAFLTNATFVTREGVTRIGAAV